MTDRPSPSSAVPRDVGDRGRPRTIAFVMDHPAQHFSPGLRAAAARGEIHPLACYWDDFAGGYRDAGFDRTVTWDVDLLAGYDSVATDPDATTARRARTIVRALREARPAAIVVAGWASRVARVAIVWATITRTPLYFYSD